MFKKNYSTKDLYLAQQRVNQYSKTNHVLHLLLSIFTAGLWLPVWLLVGVSNAIEYRRNLRLVSNALQDRQQDSLEYK